MATRDIRVGRVYDDVDADDGARVLVDRVWPRGLRKDAARLDRWVKDVAPSTELRKWYGHAPEKFEQFRSHYRSELDSDVGRAALRELREFADNGTVTLLTATKDVRYSHASVLRDLLGGAS